MVTPERTTASCDFHLRIKISHRRRWSRICDFQLVTVDGIVVENVVLFKIPRIANKNVIDGVVADLNIRPGHDIFQIYGLPVTGAG